MAVLSFDDLALMLFDFGCSGFEDFHIDNVISTVHAVSPMTADDHPDFFWDPLSRHVANARSSQVVKAQSNVLCFLLRLARCASPSVAYVRTAISAFKPTKPGANARVFLQHIEVRHKTDLRLGLLCTVIERGLE